MQWRGREQSENVETDSSLTGKGSYDGRGYRIDRGTSGGPLTRNGNVYDPKYDSRVANEKSGSSGASRVICTHLFRRGLLSKELWRADLEYTARNLSETTIRGYHYWAVPYVVLMRKHSWAEKLMLPIAKARAEEIAYQAGVAGKANVLGKIIRFMGEPLCFFLGMFVTQRDWRELWADQTARKADTSDYLA